MKHKSDDYKLNDVDYYLTEDNSQEEVCKIFISCCVYLQVNNIETVLIYNHCFYASLYL